MAGSGDTRNTPKVAMLPFASCSNLVNSTRGVDVSLCRSNGYRCGSYRLKCHTMRRRPLAIAAHYHWTRPTGQVCSSVVLQTSFAVLQGERGKTHPLMGVGSEVGGRGKNGRAASRRCGCLHPTSHFSGALNAEKGGRAAFQSWKRRYK